MKKWWQCIWESAVVIICSITVILNAVMIATYWQFTDELVAVSKVADRVEKSLDEMEVTIQLLEGRITALEMETWF